MTPPSFTPSTSSTGGSDIGRSWRHGGFALWVALDVLLAVLLGSIALGRRSFWLDESVSVTIARLDLDRFIDVTRAREANMALYHAILGGWTDLFGTSEAAARSLSVVFAAAAVVAVALVGLALHDPRVGGLAGLLLAVNPMTIRYAQEARGYALCLLLVTAASAFFVWALRTGSSLAWVGYVAAASLGAYAHSFAVLVIAAEVVSLWFVPAQALRRRTLAFVAGGLLLGLAPFVLLSAGSDSSGLAWASGNAPGRLATRIHDQPALQLLALACFAAAAVVLAQVIRRTLGERRRSWAVFAWAMPTCWLLVPPALVVLAAITYRPLFVVRYFIVVLPAFVLLVALACLAMRRTASLVVIAVVVLGSLAGVMRWYVGGQTEDWRGATRAVLSDERDDDGVLFYAPYTRIPFQLYRGSSGAPWPKPVYPAAGWATDAIEFNDYVPVTASAVAGAAARFDRIALVLSHEGLFGLTDPGYEAVAAGLASAGFRKGVTRWFDGIAVVEYRKG